MDFVPLNSRLGSNKEEGHRLRGEGLERETVGKATREGESSPPRRPSAILQSSVFSFRVSHFVLCVSCFVLRASSLLHIGGLVACLRFRGSDFEFRVQGVAS